MSEAQSEFQFEFAWSREFEEVLNSIYYMSGPLRTMHRYFWWLVGLSFLTAWGLAAILAKQGLFSGDDIGFVLKAILAGFVTALIPVLLLFLVQRVALHARPIDDLPIRISVDASGCHSNAGAMTSFIPWSSVSEVIEIDCGLILILRPNSALPIFDSKLCDAAPRENLMKHIKEWRKAAQ